MISCAAEGGLNVILGSLGVNNGLQGLISNVGKLFEGSTNPLSGMTTGQTTNDLGNIITDPTFGAWDTGIGGALPKAPSAEDTLSMFDPSYVANSGGGAGVEDVLSFFG